MFLNGTTTDWGVKEAGNMYSVVIIKGDATEPVFINSVRKGIMLIKHVEDMHLWGATRRLYIMIRIMEEKGREKVKMGEKV